MSRTRTAALHRWTAVLLCTLWAASGAAAQGTPRERSLGIASKLERAGAIDAYFPEVAFEVASALAQAAPNQWRGVQVNRPHRGGWLNIYMIDARRLPQAGMLADEGIDNFTPESLRAGALAHEDSGTIFLNTAMWKRLAAATVLTQNKVQPDLGAALATIDVIGLDAARKFWDPAALSAETPVNQRVGWLMRGALAFVLAHEMGHLRIGRTMTDEPDRLRLSRMSEREKDEARACPELMHRESRQRQKHEEAADRAGAELLGRQCRIGNDGKLRHAIFMLGTSWYFLASMSDKLIEMGRNTDSPVIAQALRSKIGPKLYEQVVAAHAAEKRRGAVAFAFPSSHPPDTARMQAIDQALRATPCGNDGLEATLAQAQLLDMFRQQMCTRLIGREPAR
jgi:hypothetical protein